MGSGALPTEASCARCGAASAPGDRFCGDCGEKLTQDGALALREAIHGERRNVAVLFADVSGFTSMAEKMDPEELAAVMNRCFATLAEPIASKNGTIDKFIGDCVMAVFGAPSAHEDDAERAAGAALEMRAALAALVPSLELPIALSIGVHAGPVVAGMVGALDRRDYTVMGDVVNQAKQLQEAAGPGRILVSERMARGIEGSFVLEPAVSLPGHRRKDLRARSLLRRRSPDDSLGEGIIMGGLGFLPPLVDREREWQELERLAESALAGEGKVACLSGEAGVGKSRLKLAARRFYLDRGLPVLEGRSASDSPLAPFVDLLKAALETRATVQSLDEKLAELGQSAALLPSERDRLARLYQGTGAREAEIDAARGRGELHSAFRKVLLPAASPTLVILEDWHLADPGSRDLFADMAREVPHHPVLVLLLQRPEQARQELPAGTVEIPLAPLTEEHCRALAEKLLVAEGLPDALVGRLIQKVEGNPLFLIQSLQAWAGAGILEATPDGYAFTGADAEPALPETVQAVIAARIDRLPAPERTLLLCASILDRSFPRSVLRRMEESMGEPSDAVEERIARLERENLLRSLRGGQVTFTHALVQEVAEATLLRADARELHGRAAKAYEAEAPGAPPATLSRHWLAADDRPRALPHVMSAARAARDAFDPERAIALFKLALEITGEHGATPDATPAAAWEGLGDVLLVRGEYAAAEFGFQSALALREAAKDRDARSEAQCLRKLAIVAQRSGRLEEAIARCRDGIARAAALDPLMAASLEALLGTICCDAGLYLEAEDWVAHARARLAEPARDRRDRGPAVKRRDVAAALAVLERTHGSALVGLGRFHEAADRFEAELALAEEIGDRWQRSIALTDLGDACARQGDQRKAALFFDRAIPEKTAIGDRAGLALAHHGRAALLYEAGDSAGAVDEARAGLALADAIGDRKAAAGLRSVLGRALFALGESSQAETELVRAMEEALAGSAVPEVVAAQVGLSGIRIAQGRVEDAVREAERALSLATHGNARPSMAEALLALGRAHERAAQHDLARERLLSALEVAGQIGNSGLRLQVLSSMAELAQSRGDDGGARDLLRAIERDSDPARDRLHRSAASLGLAEIHCRAGEPEPGFSCALRGLEEARAVNAPRLMARAYEILTRLCLLTSQFQQGEAYARDAIAVWKKQEAFGLRELGRAYLALGEVHYESASIAPMKEALAMGLDLLRRSGDRAGEAEGLLAVAATLARDEPERALELVARSLDIARAMGDVAAEIRAYGKKGEMHRRLGEVEAAAQAFESEGSLCGASAAPQTLLLHRFHMASVLHLGGELASAEAAASDTIRISEPIGDIGLLFGLELRALVQTEMGKLDPAWRDLERALEMARRLRHADRLANIHRTRAEHLLARGELDAAAIEVAEGRRAARPSVETFKEYGFLARERLDLQAARIALRRSDAEQARANVRGALAAIERFRVPLVEIEAGILACEVEADLRKALRLLASLEQRAQALGLALYRADALEVRARLGRDRESARKAHALAVAAGAAPRVLRLARLMSALS